LTKSFQVPIALLNFNRPELTRQVFEVVRQIRPRRLLIIADGPRMDMPDDARLCAEVRAVFDEIDWDCEVTRNFSDTNMGSFRRNSTGLNWVFDSVEEAIVLEDDCIPSLSFFRYSEDLLERYRNDPRVGVISGDNFGFPKPVGNNDSYFFSAYALPWGWASWRRVWKNVDLKMLWWERNYAKNILRELFPQAIVWRYWHWLFESIHNGEIKNAWDYQLILSLFRHSQFCVVPKVNLISNVGYGIDATHCTDDSSRFQNFPRGELEFPLIHPEVVRNDRSVDYSIFRSRFESRHPIYWLLLLSQHKLLKPFKRARKKSEGK
jgi:hypothetical protein